MNTTANANLFSRLFDTLDDPNRLAIEMLDGGRVTYGDLIDRSRPDRQCAGARAASSPATVSRCRSRNRCRRLVLYLAALRAGAVYLPLNTAYTLNELDYFIGDAEPTLWSAIRRRREGIAAIAAKREGRDRDARPRRQGLADGRRGQGAKLTFATVARGTTISPRSSTPRARPAAPRARC